MQPIDSFARTDRSTLIGMLLVVSSLVLAALPPFMIGGLAVQIRDELGMSEAALGTAITIGFVTGALLAPVGGRIADRIGPRRSVAMGAAGSAVRLIGLGDAVDGWVSLVVLMGVGNAALALTDPALAVVIGRVIPEPSRGLAFGVKEASIPGASLLAGLAVPTIALSVGWRWAFALGVIPLAVVALLLPRLVLTSDRAVPLDGETSTMVTSPAPIARRAVMVAAAGAALGTAAASGVGIFVTESAVAMGVGEGAAGLLLAVGGTAGIITRIGAGVMADRSGGPQFRWIAVMMAVGAVAITMGSTGVPILLLVATLGAFSGGWGWTGLFFLSLVATSPDRPGAVAGIGTAGLGLGNAAGPLLFGLLADAVSYSAGWIAAGVLGSAASATMMIARRMFWGSQPGRR